MIVDLLRRFPEIDLRQLLGQHWRMARQGVILLLRFQLSVYGFLHCGKKQLSPQCGKPVMKLVGGFVRADFQ